LLSKVVGGEPESTGSKPFLFLKDSTMYLAMRMEEEAATELETYPVYTDAEIESIEVQMNNYIVERDASWTKHKKISAKLLTLMEDLNTVKLQYNEMRGKLTGASGSDIDFEKTNDQYYKCQDRIYRLVTTMTDFRKELAKILE
jgi:hypothetical protein